MQGPLRDQLQPVTKAGRTLFTGVPEGLDAPVIADLARSGQAASVLHVAREDTRLARLAEGLGFFAPDLEVLRFPAWDCLPYDRVSPISEISSERIDTLRRLAQRGGDDPLVVLTTVNAVLQRVPPRAALKSAFFAVRPGEKIDRDALTGFLACNGYQRTSTVREPGEFAVRGGILDVFPPGHDQPVRLDLFGEVLEGIRIFDAGTQLTGGMLAYLSLAPVSEVMLDAASIARFRAGYRELFGAVGEDPLYVAVSEGRKQAGMEHWLPLFHATMETLFDYVPGALVTLDHRFEAARDARLETIADYYDARMSFDRNRPPGGAAAAVPVYRPLPPDRLYLDSAAWDAALAGGSVGCFQPFRAPDDQPHGADGGIVRFGGRQGPDFTATLAEPKRSDEAAPRSGVFDRVRQAIRDHHADRRRVIVAGYSAGTRARLGQLLDEHGVRALCPVETWPEAEALPPGGVALATLAVERGFITADLAVIGEQDILGQRLVRPPRRKRKAAAFIADAADLAPGDLVVHVEHGIGRYESLETVVALNAPHDCLRLSYAGGDRLYVPVENLEILSRYGSGESEAVLDRLGGAAWQHRKAKLKKRLLDMAGALIEVAAARRLKPAPSVTLEPALYDEFCARFPFTETEDQSEAIKDTLADLASGQPMDRLICGDVGFGKTEIALRAAFNAVHAGGQVAVVVPTTLLCRQHHATFSERFADTAVRIGRLSRLVGAKEAAATRAGIAEGSIDIVIGTHALLAKSIRFRNLGLLVGRRGAALRRRPQGEAQAAQGRCARVDDDRNADPQDPADGAQRGARDERHRHPRRSTGWRCEPMCCPTIR